jgi:hypothetical protein
LPNAQNTSGLASFTNGLSMADSLGFPEYHMPMANLQSHIYRGQMFVSSDQRLFVNTACGVFVSSDSGKTFGNLDLAKIGDSSSIVFVDGNNIYVAGANLHLSTDGGKTFTTILNGITHANVTIPAQVYQCITSPYESGYPRALITPSPFIFTSVYASGNDIIVATNNAGSLVSHDGGATFTAARAYAGGYDVSALVGLNGKISKVGNTIYATMESGAFYGFGSAPFSASVASIGGTTCSAVSGLNVGVMASTDNGNTFNPVPGIPPDYITGFQATDSSTLAIIDAGTLKISNDGGKTFSPATKVSPEVGISRPPTFSTTFTYRDLIGSDPSVAIIGDSIFTIADANIPGDTSGYRGSFLFSSQNGGATFTLVPVDPSLPIDMPFVLNLAAIGNSLFVMTDRGVYQSNDGGKTFPIHNSFSSSFCTYPWWENTTFTSTATAANRGVFLGTGFASTDGAQTFAYQAALKTGPLFTPDGSNLLQAGNPIGISTDGGASFTPTQSNTYVGPAGLKVFSTNDSDGFLQFYISADGSNLFEQLPEQSFLVSAYSNGMTVVGTAKFGAIYTNGNGKASTTPDAGIQGIVPANGNLFATGRSLMASYDAGATWATVPTVSSAWTVLGFSGLVFAPNGNLFVSSDGGRTFAPYVGKLGTPATCN